uniref:Uncharacterized protein n=1 Tax=Rhizophora mucronata TaxID=61149 RepID=A0A2P2NUL5_RHIMU
MPLASLFSNTRSDTMYKTSKVRRGIHTN